MNALARVACVVAALAAIGWCSRRERPLAHAPGVLVPDAPLQERLLGGESLPPRADAAFKPLARFAAAARVLGRRDYRDALSALVPTDLALGWGRMSDSAVLEKVDISQSGRFYFWRVARFPIPEGEIIASSANMHLVAADDDVAREIARVRVGDVVRFAGYLIEIDRRDGSRAVSSLSRTDTGAGACEIVWAEAFSIDPPSP